MATLLLVEPGLQLLCAAQTSSKAHMQPLFLPSWPLCSWNIWGGNGMIHKAGLPHWIWSSFQGDTYGKWSDIHSSMLAFPA